MSNENETVTETTTVDAPATYTKTCIVAGCTETFEVLVKRGKGKPRGKCYTHSPKMVKVKTPKTAKTATVVETPVTPAETEAATEVQVAPGVLAPPADETSADVYV